jgi:c-di-AMP phosphodiesterase-like protein
MTTFEREKEEYLTKLFGAITETEDLVKRFPQLYIYDSILNQLLYIKNILVDQGRIPAPDELERITLGAIAIKNFDDYSGVQDPYGQMLIRIYGGICLYADEAHGGANAQAAAKKYLEKLKIKYDTIEEAALREDEVIVTKDGSKLDIFWVVPYNYTVFQDETAFIYLRKSDLKLIYILTNHGWITE